MCILCTSLFINCLWFKHALNFSPFGPRSETQEWMEDTTDETDGEVAENKSASSSLTRRSRALSLWIIGFRWPKIECVTICYYLDFWPQNSLKMTHFLNSIAKLEMKPPLSIFFLGYFLAAWGGQGRSSSALSLSDGRIRVQMELIPSMNSAKSPCWSWGFKHGNMIFFDADINVMTLTSMLRNLRFPVAQKKSPGSVFLIQTFSAVPRVRYWAMGCLGRNIPRGSVGCWCFLRFSPFLDFFKWIFYDFLLSILV